ncbi:MAG: cytochrome C [Candidatus Competibacteraceae bacterium]|nr:cytochrome C [Candidatus Competibacteraceae bacterium]
MKKSNSKIKFLLAGLLIVGLPAVVASSWLATQSVIESTSDHAFCTKCHSMKVFGESYLLDVHGGNNAVGVQVVCTDCHLPHDTLTNYLFTKAKTGIHDVWAEYTLDLEKIDWEAKRQHREDFVYDSGCLKCHSNLEKATSASNKAFVAHKPYFLGTIDNTCVSCHEYVGHQDLTTFIQKLQ